MKTFWIGVGLLLFMIIGGVCYFLMNSTPATISSTKSTGASGSHAEEVYAFCAACHAFPPPDSFPREVWEHHVDNAFLFLESSGRKLNPPSARSLTAYYRNRAPEKLPLPERPIAPGKPLVNWTRRGYAIPNRAPAPLITHLKAVQFSSAEKMQILVCEAEPLKNEGQIWLFNPHANQWRSIATIASPAHAEVIDLDGDGRKDILVASLGHFFPTDQKVGGVFWLRRKPDGSFERIVLLKDIGRVADVQAGDFNGDGKLDLLVAEFGWRKVGSIRLLENKTVDWSKPQFEPRILDSRTGAINVPVVDLNGDGLLDFIALISQEHEIVVAFLQEKNGRFKQETIYAAPHPAYGSCGIELADMDGDGDVDLVYSNGDTLDRPFLVKPYHGVHWLENQGRYPFVAHRLANMPGAQRASIADVDGDGDLDIVVVSYLPAVELPRTELNLDAILLLEQTSKRKFVRRPLETRSCDHFTCAMADLYGTGRPSLIVGNFYSAKQRPIKDWLSIWSSP